MTELTIAGLRGFAKRLGIDMKNKTADVLKEKILDGISKAAKDAKTKGKVKQWAKENQDMVDFYETFVNVDESKDKKKGKVSEKELDKVEEEIEEKTKKVKAKAKDVKAKKGTGKKENKKGVEWKEGSLRQQVFVALKKKKSGFTVEEAMKALTKLETSQLHGLIIAVFKDAVGRGLAKREGDRYIAK